MDADIAEMEIEAAIFRDEAMIARLELEGIIKPEPKGEPQ